MTSDNDLIVWSDGTFCFRYDLAEYSWMSDDYYVLPFATKAYYQFLDYYEVPL